MNIRAFVAVRVPDRCAEEAGRMTAELAKGLPLGKWVAPENLHFTLCFLGSVGPETAGKVEEKLGEIAGEGGFELKLVGLGAFPNERRASVLWTGVSEGAGHIAALAENVRLACSKSGVTVEEREWVPHLTLARFRTPARLAGIEVFEKLRETVIGTCIVDRFFLMRSHLGPNGPKYEILREYPLGRKA